MYLQSSKLIFLSIIGLFSGQNALLPPGPENGAVGESVLFTTIDPPPGPFATIKWTFNVDAPILTYTNTAYIQPEYTGRIIFNRNTGSLRLQNLTLNDSGEYHVDITPQDASLEKRGKTTLIVFVLVSNVRIAANETDLVEFNSSVSLTCSTSGSSASFQWLNGSSEVTASGGVQLGDGNCTILNVTRYDMGPFRCVASNAISNGLSQNLTLNISYGPDNAAVIVTVTPLSPFYGSGSDLTLSCSAESNPPAQFQWALNGTLLGREGAGLILENIQANQRGSYICLAHNHITLRSVLSEPISITVLEKIAGAIVTSPGNVTEGERYANLTCEGTGSIITREWMKKGPPLSSNRITFSADNRTLSIIPVNRTDSGEYTCKLSNPFSKITANNNLTVNYGPERVFIEGQKEVEIEKKVTLNCLSDSVPSATYTWMLNGTEKDETAATFIIEKTDYTDSGTYSCTARNDATGLNMSAEHALSVKARNVAGGLSGGAIAGIVIGTLLVVAVVIGGVVYFVMFKNGQLSTRERSGQRNAPRHSNGGEPELNYADISHFQKANGGRVQLGNMNASGKVKHGATANQRPPPPSYETHHAQISRPGSQTTDVTYAEVKNRPL